MWSVCAKYIAKGLVRASERGVAVPFRGLAAVTVRTFCEFLCKTVHFRAFRFQKVTILHLEELAVYCYTSLLL